MTITLPGLETEPENGSHFGGYGQGSTETETRQAIIEIESEIPTTGMRRALKQAAISLSISIDRGNAKGRSVANDVAQLIEIMSRLSPAEDGDGESVDDSRLTPEMRRLLDALAAPAQLDTPPASDAA